MITRRWKVAGEVDDLLASHRMLTGPAAEAGRYAERLSVVHARRGEAQAHLLVRTNGSADPVPPGWEAHPVGLGDSPWPTCASPAPRRCPARVRHAEPSEVTK